jgi:hypothetical protein
MAAQVGESIRTQEANKRLSERLLERRPYQERCLRQLVLKSDADGARKAPVRNACSGQDGKLQDIGLRYIRAAAEADDVAFPTCECEVAARFITINEQLRYARELDVWDGHSTFTKVSG